jgi:hypothetical protein
MNQYFWPRVLEGQDKGAHDDSEIKDIKLYKFLEKTDIPQEVFLAVFLANYKKYLFFSIYSTEAALQNIFAMNFEITSIVTQNHLNIYRFGPIFGLAKNSQDSPFKGITMLL